MNKINTDLPVMINGVVITESIIRELATLQLKDTAPSEAPVFDNSGIKDRTTDIADIVHFVLGEMTSRATDESIADMLKLLEKLFFLRDTIDRFKAPSEFYNLPNER